MQKNQIGTIPYIGSQKAIMVEDAKGIKEMIFELWDVLCYAMSEEVYRMRLEEYIKTDEYKNANCVEYIGVDGMELPYSENELMEYDVIGHHTGSGGYLEIQLNAL